MDFTKLDGLIPAVVQDVDSREVLMVGFMNETALARTRESGYATFFSRTRGKLWMKGETSGNRLAVERILVDCDEDTVLLLVRREGEGNVCHTGERSCFYRDLEGSAPDEPDGPPVPGEPLPVPFEALPELERTLVARKKERPAGSYTVELLDDPALAADKVKEEAAEVIKAVRSESEERCAEEGADVVYHLAVLLLSRGVSMAEVLRILSARRR